ncbi:MAG: HesA/MoeB/ThiF family protein [Synechococcus lacustris]
MTLAPPLAPLSPGLTEQQRERYRRQLQLPNFGEAAQQRLLESSVLVTGVGGLGGTVALYLAAAGIGQLVLARGGNLRLDDLNRQVLMRNDGVGQLRVDQAAESLRRFNPETLVVAVADYVTAENVGGLVAQAEIAVDATHNFEERYLLNDACLQAGIPMVEAAMDDMEAHLTTIVPGLTPCLRCLNPEPPPWDRRGFGVLGAVSGALACLAALEVIKQLTGCGPTLQGELARLDFNQLSMRRLRLQRDPHCPSCGSLQP